MENDILKAIELLKSGKTGKVSKNIYTVENAVVFRDIKESYNKEFKNVQEVIAIKTNEGVILGNSSRMQELEDRRFKKIIQPARIQRILSDVITMIPFTVFKEAGLDLLSCSILDSGQAETLKELKDRWSTETIDRHFTGARLFKATSKQFLADNKTVAVKQERYFLVDVDRNEIKHNIINFFLAEIPEKCSSIVEAYDLLKPNEVKLFEQNTNTEVLRQGEFFFIPTKLTINQYNGITDKKIREIRLGNSRPNRVENGFEFEGNIYVNGTISHTGREHKDLELDKTRWFKVVPNTSKANFQLTGDID